jgi:hypothetical protein
MTGDITKSDITEAPSMRDIIDEWSESRPYLAPKNSDDWSMMLARRMARLPKEKKARRMYYDLFEYRCR